MDGKCYSLQDKYERLLVRFLKENNAQDILTKINTLNLKNFIVGNVPCLYLIKLFQLLMSNGCDIEEYKHLSNKWINFINKEVARDICFVFIEIYSNNLYSNSTKTYDSYAYGILGDMMHYLTLLLKYIDGDKSSIPSMEIESMITSFVLPFNMSSCQFAYYFYTLKYDANRKI